MRGQVDAIVLFEELAHGAASPAQTLLKRHVDLFVRGMSQEYKIEIILDQTLHDYMEERVKDVSNAREVEELVNDALFAPVTQALLKGSCASHSRMSWNADEAIVEVLPVNSVDEEE